MGEYAEIHGLLASLQSSLQFFYLGFEQKFNEMVQKEESNEAWKAKMEKMVGELVKRVSIVPESASVACQTFESSQTPKGKIGIAISQLLFNQKELVSRACQTETVVNEQKDATPTESKDKKSNVPDKSANRASGGTENCMVVCMEESFEVSRRKEAPLNQTSTTPVSSRPLRRRLEELKREVVLSENTNGSCSSDSNETEMSSEHDCDQFKHICHACGKSFRERNALVSHINEHLRNMRCLTCGVEFPTKDQLDKHAHVHTSERPFECDTCGKRFKQIDRLHKHYLVHGDRAFNCHVCGKGFRDRRKLEIHYRTHTGERPYACTICSKRFSTKHGLVKHALVHTDEPKGDTCPECGEYFPDLRSLRRHLTVHEVAQRSSARIAAHVPS